MILPILMFALATAPPVDDAWTVLKQGVEDKSSYKRVNAVHALGLLPKNQKAQAMAEQALSDENAEVRMEAATALGQMGAVSSRQKLRDALNDKDPKVVVAAANSLYLMKDPAAYEVYYALLTGERKSSAGLLQSQLNILKDRKALEKMIFETGIGFVPFGGMGYQAWKTVTQDDTSPVRAASAEKLATDPDPQSGQALTQFCTDRKWRVRVAVIDAIAKRGDPSLSNALVPLLTDENDSVRDMAAAGILRLAAVQRTRSRVRH
jgi:HEAT repeat protein